MTEGYGGSVKSLIKFNGIFEAFNGLEKGGLNKYLITQTLASVPGLLANTIASS